MSSENQLSTITTQISPVLERGETMEINTPEDLKEATSILSQANKTLDQIKEEKEKVLAPLREAANAEKSRWEPLESRFKPVVTRLRSLMSDYQTKALAKKKEDDDKIANRVGDGRGKLKVETAIKKMGENTVETKIEVDNGGLSFRATQTLKIVSEAMIPREYLVPDEKAILKALKDGTLVPGCVIETIQVPVNKR